MRFFYYKETLSRTKVKGAVHHLLAFLSPPQAVVQCAAFALSLKAPVT